MKRAKLTGTVFNRVESVSDGERLSLKRQSVDAFSYCDGVWRCQLSYRWKSHNFFFEKISSLLSQNYALVFQ